MDEWNESIDEFFKNKRKKNKFDDPLFVLSVADRIINRKKTSEQIICQFQIVVPKHKVPLVDALFKELVNFLNEKN